MKTIAKILLVALTVSSVSFVGCKKGEGDPFLSLSSRKARLAGEWKVVSGEGTTSGNGVSGVHTYDGTTQTSVYTPGGTFTDKYTQEFEFEKDGTYKMVYTDNNTSTPVVTTEMGTWNWTGGVGEEKGKSAIVMYTESSATGSTTDTWSGDDRPATIMRIYQLKGKEIIFEYNGTDNNNTTSTMKWTLEPK